MVKTFEELGIELPSRSGNVSVPCPFDGCRDRKKKGLPTLSLKLTQGDDGLEGPYQCFHCNEAGYAVERRRIDNPNNSKEPAPVFSPTAMTTPPPIETYLRPPKLLDLPSEPTYEFFAKRGISKETVDHFKITEGVVKMPVASTPSGEKVPEGERKAILFPYFRRGELIDIKYRGRYKSFKLAYKAERILFNIDSIRTSDRVVIVEGEPDCMALYEAGVRDAVSVPNGAPPKPREGQPERQVNLSYLDNSWDEVNRCKKVVIAVDNDEPGQRLKAELIRRMGEHRCWIVTWPAGCKDANDVLVQHGPDKLRECIDNATPQPITHVYEDEEIDREMIYYYENGFPKGLELGWPKFDRHFRLRAPQLLVVTGHNNVGKSRSFDEIMRRTALKGGWKWAIFSFEQQPAALHASMMAEQIVGLPLMGHGRMNEYQHERARRFIKDHFVFVKLSEADISMRGILNKVVELVGKRGINAFLVDPWNEIEHKMGKGQSETLYVSEALSQVKQVLHSSGCLGAFVVHPTKAVTDKNGNLVPAKLKDCSGSNNFANKADMGLSIYRHVMMEEGQSDPVDFSIEKVRYFFDGKRGVVQMDYNLRNHRYKERGQEDEPVMETAPGVKAMVLHNEPPQIQQRFGIPVTSLREYGANFGIDFTQPVREDDDETDDENPPF